jgi:hypothetical protein
MVFIVLPFKVAFSGKGALKQVQAFRYLRHLDATGEAQCDAPHEAVIRISFCTPIKL